MISILISIRKKHWQEIANGTKKFEIRKSKPKNIRFPFNVVCISNGKIVGWFVCNYIVISHNYAWHIDSVEVLEEPIDFRALGIKKIPRTWQHLTVEDAEKLTLFK